MARKSNQRTTEIVDLGQPTDKLKVAIKSGDSFVRLPKRMIFVEDGHAVVSRAEYELLKKMKVAD